MEAKPAGVRRRSLLAGAASAAGAMAAAPLLRDRAAAATASSRVVYNLNPDWRFVQKDVAGAEAPAFDDSAWLAVSVPHTYNDVDSFDNYITSSGESAVAMQITWYRRHFTMPASHQGQKVLLEFEGVRQAATVYVNGVQVGPVRERRGPVRLRHHRPGALRRRQRHRGEGRQHQVAAGTVQRPAVRVGHPRLQPRVRRTDP
jgi:hypothetical protein